MQALIAVTRRRRHRRARSPPRPCASSSGVGGALRSFLRVRVGAARRRRHRCHGPGAARPRRWRSADAPTRYCWARSGGPKWSDPNAKVRPEQGLLQLRKALGLFANLRPVVPHPAVLDASPIKAELLHGVDIMVVRELTGGIYFGDKQRSGDRGVRRVPLQRGRDRARGAGRGAAGARPPPQAHLRRQGQRARDLAPVALRGRAHHAARVSRRELRAHAGGFGRHASA